MSDETIIGSVLGVLVAIVAGLIVFAVVSGGASCPKGQHLGIVTFIPETISTGSYSSVTIITPIYACEAS